MEFSKMNIIDEKLSLIEKQIYDEKMPLLNWKMRKARFNADGKYEKYSKYQDITIGDKWTCRFDEALFLETSFIIPKQMAGKRIVLDLSLGGEGLVYINGQAKSSIAFYYNPGQSVLSGVTRERRRIDVAEKAVANKKYDILVELNINYKDYFKSNRFLKYEDEIEEDYIFNHAYVASINKEVEAYYFDLKNLVDTIKLLDTPASFAAKKIQTCKLDLSFDRLLRNMNRDDDLRQKMLQAVLESLSKIDFYDDNFISSIDEASKILKDNIKKLPRVERGEVYATGFSHVDLVWLWQIRHTIRKLANTFLNAISLIERYPDFIFTFSQPFAFELLEEYYPELFKKVKKYINEGRIDVVGNAYVEMDTNVAGGEAIVRQLLYGRQYYLNKFNKDSDVFFMPDSFGFSASLPQIIKESGIKYFFTDKLASFNETYRFPHTLFMWQGIDGTKIPAYLERCSYNGCLNPERIDEAYGRSENKQITNKAYITFGYGDGGGGADYVMAENYSRLKNMSGLPKVKMHTVSDFFNDVTKKADDFPIWNDELYLDAHRGTYTSHGDIKKYNRQAELSLRRLEIASWIREKACGIKYPKQDIKELWKIILPMQFHDSLPGTCISQVYEEFRNKYEEFFKKINSLTKEVIEDINANIKHKDGEKIAYNFLSWERKDLVDGKYIDIPSIGYSVISDNKTSVVKVRNKTIENKFFKLRFDDNGNIDSLILKENNREMLKNTSNIFELFDDPSSARMSAWDLNKEYKNSFKRIVKANNFEIINEGYKAVAKVDKEFGKSTISQEIIVYSDIERIDFKTKVDWHENMKMLKVAYYPNITTSKATYEIQFGAIERPTHHNNEYDEVRFEACGHRWADMSQNDCGLAIMNDCKYGYDAYDGTFRLTLLRSPLEPDYKADRGINEFTYSIYPHISTWQNSEVVNRAYELNEKVYLANNKMMKDVIKSASFVQVDNKDIILETVKKAEDDDAYIFRFYEANGGGGMTNVKLAFDIKEVIQTNLMEKEERKLKVKDNSFKFEANPYKIYSFKIK